MQCGDMVRCWRVSRESSGQSLGDLQFFMIGAAHSQSHRVPLNLAKTMTLDTLEATTTWKYIMFVMIVQDPDCHDSRALEACSLSLIGFRCHLAIFMWHLMEVLEVLQILIPLRCIVCSDSTSVLYLGDTPERHPLCAWCPEEPPADSAFLLNGR